ncbi:Fungalysin metallopeptidase-domain-containing protein [Mycena rebaudengoi]|nr:Fungalysin metallopeptidase-domain-containing protein [Mycena rebaudengoi]
MPALNIFFVSVLAVVYSSNVMAVPSPATEPRFASAKLSTARTHMLPSGLTIESYNPPSILETFGAGIDHPLHKRAGASLQESSVAFIQDKLNLTYTGAAARYSYAAQTHKGISYANAVANVAFNKDDKVVVFGSSFVTPKARATAEKQLAGSHEGLSASKFKYLAKDDGSAALVYSFQVSNEATGTWYEAFVDAHSGELLSVVDFVAQASKEALLEGSEKLVDPQDAIASPNGWHTTNTENSTFTSGNNPGAFTGTAATGRIPETANGLVFEYVQDPAQEPTVDVNVGAAVVNAFYLINTVHDITYRYGFTEAAFNFQNDNFGLDGVANDRVTSSIQDIAGSDNVDFSTPPECVVSPKGDGALENDVVVHEAMHGVTNRMTGGGTARCLRAPEAGGMGEGWLGAMAEWTEQKNATITTNPLTYGSLAKLTEVHNIGEVWANILHNHGFSTTAFTDPDQTEGNVVYLHLLIDALTPQPCSPKFPTARDAWIQADVNRYTGANKCLLWTAFASRGLGVGAADHVDSAAVPEDCVAA